MCAIKWNGIEAQMIKLKKRKMKTNSIFPPVIRSRVFGRDYFSLSPPPFESVPIVSVQMHSRAVK